MKRNLILLEEIRKKIIIKKPEKGIDMVSGKDTMGATNKIRKRKMTPIPQEVIDELESNVKRLRSFLGKEDTGVSVSHWGIHDGDALMDRMVLTLRAVRNLLPPLSWAHNEVNDVLKKYEESKQ